MWRWGAAAASDSTNLWPTMPWPMTMTFMLFSLCPRRCGACCGTAETGAEGAQAGDDDQGAEDHQGLAHVARPFHQEAGQHRTDIAARADDAGHAAERRRCHEG